MNFESFDGIKHSDAYVVKYLTVNGRGILIIDLFRYFWQIACPFVFAITVFLM